MTLDQVESFVAVARTRSFRVAARTLGLSQPAVTRHVQALEKSLNARLVIRSRTGCELTPNAKEFFAHAEALVALQTRARTCLHQRRLVIGASSNIGTYLLPRIISRFEKAHASTAVEVLVTNNETVLAKLETGLVDVALTEWWNEKPEFTAEVWRREPLVVIVPADHSWSTRESVPAEWLFDEKIIGGERGTGTGTLLREALGPSAAALAVTKQFGNTEAVKEAVRHRLGISLVMASAVRDEVASGDLRALQIDGHALAKRLFFVTRHWSAANSAMVAFRQVLADSQN